MNKYTSLPSIINTIRSYNAELLIVTKKQSIETILELYHLGFRNFGENRVQELVQKETVLPKDIRWHFIGNLQRNKVKYIAPFVEVIHSIESFKLLQEVNKQAQKYERMISCLIEVHVSSERSKHGFEPNEVSLFLQQKQIGQFKNILIKGFMTMATYTFDKDLIRQEFRSLYQLFLKLKNKKLAQNIVLETLSMGMSQDYQIALEENSTLVRLGSLIFR